MWHGSQSTGKYTTPKRSYFLKSTSFLGLASFHHVSTNATTQASPSPPTHTHPTTYYLARHWCSGARPRNAMNLVCRKSKIREKTSLGALGKETSPAGRLGMTSGCFFQQIREIREKTDFRGGKNK